MICFFPSLYPDELLYSLLARYYAKSGYLAYTFAAQDLFVSKTDRPDIEFLNHFTAEALCLITRDMPLIDVIMQHTMFPYFGRFIEPERRRQALQSLIAMNKEYKNLLSLPTSKDRIPRRLRYCPLCVEADRNSYGETYWHRTHQMVGVNICPTHHCQLIDSKLTISSKASPSLISAEEVVRSPERITFSQNATECRLAEYIAEVFQATIDMESDITTGQFLQARLANTKYLSLRGKQRNMALLHADFSTFFDTLPQPEFSQQWQLQKLFANQRYNTHEVCMLAMFLGIPASDLSHMTLPEISQTELFDEKIIELHKQGLNYQQIADTLQTSYNTVKAIGEGRYGTYHYYSDNPRKGGTKKLDWHAFDTAILPVVRKAICELYGGGLVRPTRITVSTIERHLGLPKKKLQNCPLCLVEIHKYAETQQEYWAREVEWAVRILTHEGRQINTTNIMKKTNMRIRDIECCCPHINAPETRILVSSLLACR